MIDSGPWGAVQEAGRPRCREQECNPIPPAWRETHFLKELEDILPGDAIECLCNIQLQEERVRLAAVQSSDGILHVEKTLMVVL